MLCALAAACAGAAGADLVYDRYGYYEAETLFAAYGIYSFLCCLGLAFGAGLLRRLVKRDEGYYGDDRP